MRLVAVDVGNTSTAVGLWSEGRVSRVSHHDGGFASASAAVERLFASCAAKPAGVAYLSVVPSADLAWRRFAQRSLKRPFMQISHKLFPLKIDYARPETIGADRLADAAAAVDRYGAPVIVCDFGTAFTAAAITADRVWRGGAIAPGLPLMLDYLHSRTAKLPRVSPNGPWPRSCGSTEASMRFGAFVGCRGMVREIVAELSRNFRTDFRLVATGGFARKALRGMERDFVFDRTLTLHGAGLLGAAALGGGGAGKGMP